ncbi:MAG: efflux RND transporter permease subunit, partial [Candidatus Fimimonas sp.]
MPAQQAVVEGCKSRLRPILMTTLTTVLALVPLALGLGRGGELMQPMGIVVIGGLLLGTLVTLVLIPCFYCIVKRISFQNYNGGGTTENATATTENAAESATANPSATETANTATATDSTADFATPSAN